MMRTMHLLTALTIRQTVRNASRRLLTTTSNQAAATKIAEIDQKLRNRHEELHIPAQENADAVRRKRMIYRSKQRGWLEVDLLLGSWAEKNVPTLDSKLLDEYELLLREETIDTYNYISGKDPLPAHLKDLKIMKILQDYALTNQVMDPARYEQFKRENRLT